MTPPAPARLLLDEMCAPALASALRGSGHGVIAVAERPDLRAMTDAQVFVWAANERMWLVTENVKDFRPLLLYALEAGSTTLGLLYTSNRAFPRSRRNPGPLIDALDAWLRAGSPPPPVVEDWLSNAAHREP